VPAKSGGMCHDDQTELACRSSSILTGGIRRMTGAMTTMPLHEVLQRRFGVDEDDFTAALVDFVDRAGPLALVDVDPTDYFGERQRSALRKLGATLTPLEASELGPVAGLAVANARVVSH